MKTYLLGASVAANLALIVKILTTVAALDSPHPQTFDTRARLGRELASNPSNSSMSKQAVYSEIVRAAESTVADNIRDYWSLAPDSPFDYARALAVAHDRARARLLARYGQRAKIDEVFESLFRPLDPRFGFLTSDQQIAVQRVRLEFQRKQTASARQTMRVGNSGGPTKHTRAAAYDHTPLRAALSEVLDAESLFEYELRVSPLAAQLISSGVKFSESEFRESFRILQRLEQRDLSAADYLDVRDALRSLIGPTRFTRFWASLDPRFDAIRRTTDRFELREDTVFSAYEIINDAQERMLREMRNPGADPDRRIEFIENLRAEQAGRLAGLMGDDVAQHVLNTLDRMTIALTQL